MGLWLSHGNGRFTDSSRMAVRPKGLFREWCWGAPGTQGDVTAKVKHRPCVEEGPRRGWGPGVQSDVTS